MNKKLKKKVSYMANGGTIKYSLDANGNLVQDPNGTMDQNGITIPNFQPDSNPNIQQDYDNAQLANTNQGSTDSTNSYSTTGGYIQQGAKALGSVLDTVGSISRGIITAAPGIINTLLGPEDTKQRKFQIDSANNNALGNGTQAFRNGGTFVDNYSKGAEYIRPIEIAKSGAVVTNYGIGENVPNLTDAQSQALNTFIPYQPSIHDEVGITTRSGNSATEPFMKSYGTAVTGANAYQGGNYSGQMWGNSANIGPAVQGQSDPYGSSYIPMDNGQFRINTDLAPTRFSYNTNAPYQMGDGGTIKPSFNDYYKTIPKEKNYTGDYNLEQAYNDLPYDQMVKFANSDGHLPDTYKLPNHPTFSNESMYYDGITPGLGGYWNEDNYISNPKIGPPMTPNMKDGGEINIKKSHKGLFTKKAKSHGESVQGFANKVLANKDSYSSATVKQAQFAHNFRGNKAELGTEINSQSVLSPPNNNQGYNINDFKVNPLQANVVAEGGEFAQLPDGSTGNITGDKHSDPSGGEYLNLPDQTRIYSDKLKVDKDFAGTVLNTKVKRKFSIADLAKKFNTDKDDQVLTDKNSTDLAKRTASINKEIKTNKLDEIFNYQEGLKNPVIDNNNLPMAEDGIEIGDNNKIVPDGYTPYVDQGYMYNGEYINAQPYNANYRNPRYMFLNPVVADAAQSSDNSSLQPLDNTLPQLPVNTNTSPIQPVNVPQTSYTQPSTNTSPSVAQNALGTAKKFSNGLGSGIKDFIPELFGLSQALSPFPIHTSKFQPIYMNPTEINVQDNLNRNYASAKGLLDTPGNNSISNARAQQTAANLYDANNQVYQQKYNIDNQNRQQVAQYNNQLENNANQTNLQRVDQFWDKMTARKANQEKDLQNIVNSAYSKSKSQQLESRQLDLVNQMFPNYKYNANQGEQFVPMTGPDGQIFHVPVSSLQSPNSTVQQGDGVKTTIKRKFNPKTGKYDTTQTDSEKSGY